MEKVEIELKLGEFEDLEELQDELNEHDDHLLFLACQIYPAGDDRAEVDQGSLSIEGIRKVRENEYEFDFCYDWYAHYGCSDLDRDGYTEGTLEFTLKDDTAYFSMEPPPVRDTIEEF